MKTRPDAKLKTLPEDTQAALWEFFAADATRKLADAVPWLKSEHDVVTNPKRLSEWFGWYERKLDIETAQSEAAEIEEALKRAGKYSAQQIEELGNLVFLNRATKSGDVKAFTSVANILQGRQSLNDARTAHADKMAVAHEKLKLAKANLDRQLKELEMKVATYEAQNKKVERVLNESKDAGASPHLVSAIREALNFRPAVKKDGET